MKGRGANDNILSPLHILLELRFKALMIPGLQRRCQKMLEARQNAGRMRNLPICGKGKSLPICALLFLSVLFPHVTKAAGVTIITHGYDGDVTGWIAAMAEDIPTYFHYRYSGLSTNFTIYTITLTTDGTSYFYQWTRDGGDSPSNTDSGEIIVKLDWSQMAGGLDPYEPYDISTSNVAQIVNYMLFANEHNCRP